MYQVAAAVRALGTRDVFDYIAMFAPLVLSVVAIGISISTARKQNQIALFNMRYDAIVDMRKMIVFAARIKGAPSAKLIKIMYDGMFDTRVFDADDVDAITQVLSTTSVMEKSTLVKALVSDNEFSEIQHLTYSLQELMLRVVHEDDFSKEKEAYCASCEAFYNGTYKRLCKKLKV